MASRFRSEPLNLLDRLNDGVRFLRFLSDYALEGVLQAGAAIPDSRTIGTEMPQVEERPLTRYERAHHDQILVRRGFLPDGTPIRADADYSILHHDFGYSGPRGDVA